MFIPSFILFQVAATPYYLLGVLVIGLVAYIIAQKRNIKGHKQQIVNLEQQVQELDRQNRILDKSLGEKSTECELLRKSIDQTEQLKRTMQVEFENTANRLFSEKKREFSETNQITLNQLLTPLKENLEHFSRKVDSVYGDETKQRTELKEQVRQLVEMNRQMSEEAKNLTRALKGESKTQGNWGEVILERMLEQSGMTRDREYSIQNSVSNEDGKRLIPDVVLHFPDERHVIVDSKVSLSAYNRSIEVTDEQMRKAALKENLLSVRKHVDELSKKDYSQVIEGTLDFTIMFMPIEGAYIAALQEDPQLWQYAYMRKIILISPTNLLAVLKLIDNLWSRDRQWKNAQEISRRGGLLLDKFVGFCQNMDKINDHLTKAQSAYNTAYGQLDNLKKQAHKLQELGIKSKNRLPQTEYQDE